MNFTQAVQSVFSNYANFNGRARRSEYWYFVLFQMIVSFVLNSLARNSGLFGALSTLYSLAVLIPSLAVAIRRLHDTGRPGWKLLIGLIPLVGWVMLLIWMTQDSEAATNEYGPSTKA